MGLEGGGEDEKTFIGTIGGASSSKSLLAPGREFISLSSSSEVLDEDDRLTSGGEERPRKSGLQLSRRLGSLGVVQFALPGVNNGDMEVARRELLLGVLSGELFRFRVGVFGGLE